jgi:23S rRNA pseudouridine2605 synthase
MFEEIGHSVEKIRRIGYGPLVLDITPGEYRELEAAEIEALQRATKPGARSADARPRARRVSSGAKQTQRRSVPKPRRPAST